MKAHANVHLILENEAANVSLVREALSGVAEAIALDRGELDDIKTAVSEACNNVVLHAYRGGTGPLEVEIFLADGTLEVVVSDRGVGIRPRPVDEERSPGVGLAVMQALSRRVEFSGGPGTSVRMAFPLPEQVDLGISAGQADGYRADLPPGDIVVSVSPPELSSSVLGRLSGALSARARFSIDRLSDAQLVTDALAGAADPLTVALTSAERRLDLRLGPLTPGTGDRVLGHGSIDALVSKLVDEIAMESGEGHEVLHLGLNDPRHPAS